MKIDLTICGVKELPDQEGKAWTHVISIWNKDFVYDVPCRKRIEALAPESQMHFSFFDDTDNPDHPNAPRLQDMKRILTFTADLTAKAKVLVHCKAGISRSVATAYAILCQHSAPGMEMENLLHVQTLRDLVMPNKLVIELADKVLKRKGEMMLHLPRDTQPAAFLRPMVPRVS
jgi:predicted protein tyrosine phosphatase